MSKTKKIAIVANSTWNIYNFRLSLIQRLTKEGYRVIVIAPVDEYIHYLNDIYFVKHIDLKQLKAQSKNPFKDVSLTLELYRIFRQEKPDLILNYTVKPNIYGNLAAKWLNIPTISTLTGLGYTFLHGKTLKSFIKILYKWSLSYPAKVIFHNSDDLNLFRQINLLKKDNGEVIFGSGVNTTHFSPDTKKESSKFIFLFVGRILVYKGIGEYIEAVRKIQKVTGNAQFWVVGELDENKSASFSKDEFQRALEDHTIRYFGTVKDIRPYISQADVFVLPSYREGMPRAVLEAMAMGKPIITTKVAGCRETVVEGENGFLIPHKDAISLAEALLKMYHLEKKELDKMGEKSRQLVLNKFDEQLIINRYLKLIQTILDPNSNHHQKSKTSSAIF